MRARPSMYSRPNKPMIVAIPKRDWTARTVEAKTLAAPVVVDAATECHATPPAIAARMVSYARKISGDVLEPSAGTGNLVRAILAAGCATDRLTMVEMHTRLADGLRSIGPVICADFLEWATETEKRFDTIVANPPFKKVRSHMSAAVSLLKSGGRLVALVPVTYDDHDCEEIEQLPEDTFWTAKVHTKIVIITSPQ